MNRTFNCLLLSALLIGAGNCPQIVLAQDDASHRLEEVVVTAQRREQNLQTVPIAVSAISSDALKQAGLAGFEDIGKIVPGVIIGNGQASQSAASIRGINSFPFGFGVESSVAFYLDGIYLGAGYDVLGELMDVLQIEVLKGPQGKLFGRNASAGAINVRTVRPNEELSASVSANVGNFDLRALKVSGNLPLMNDTLLVRGGINRKKRGGWQTNVVSGAEDGYQLDRWSGYLKALWLVSEDVEAEFIGDYSDQNDHPGYVSIGAITDRFAPYYEGANINSFSSKNQTKFAAGANGFTFSGLPVAPAEVASIERTREISGLAAKLTWDISDSLVFQSFSSYRTSDGTSGTNADGSNLGFLNTFINSTTTEYNQEFRISSSGNYSDWFAGVNIYKQNIERDFRVNTSGLIVFGQSALAGNPIDTSLLGQPVSEQSSGKNITDSYAVFGDYIWHATERMNITVGLRYSYDDKQFQQFETANNTLDGGGIIFPTIDQLEDPADVEVEDSWDNLSGRIVLDYQFSDDVLAYFSVSQGYKSGGFNTTRTVGIVDGETITPASSTEPFDEETNVNVELGIKSTILDGRLRLNTSIFNYEYSDLQFLLGDAEAPVTRTVNAGSVDGYGWDAEGQFFVNQSLSVFANVALLHTEYGEDVIDNAGEIRIFDGADRTFSPEVSAALGLDYTVQIGGSGELRTNLSYSYTGSHIQSETSTAVTFNDREVIEQDAYSVVNARISWLSSDGHWEVALWGKNLTDEYYTTLISGGGSTTSGVAIDYTAEPRTFGVNVIYDY